MYGSHFFLHQELVTSIINTINKNYESSLSFSIGLVWYSLLKKDFAFVDSLLQSLTELRESRVLCNQSYVSNGSCNHCGLMEYSFCNPLYKGVTVHKTRRRNVLTSQPVLTRMSFLGHADNSIKQRIDVLLNQNYLVL